MKAINRTVPLFPCPFISLLDREDPEKKAMKNGIRLPYGPEQMSLFNIIELSNKSRCVGRKCGPPLTKLVSGATLKNMYLTQGKSLEDIARILGCTRPTVQSLLERHAIVRRTRSAARTLAIKNNKIARFEYDNIDESFFSMWTPAMAWVLGLLFTDGYIKETGEGLRVAISSVDVEMLDKVRMHLASSRPIRKKVQSYDKTKHIFSFEFYRERMREDLMFLGLKQRKSLIMCFPEVPEPFVRHFIRGCWDGDGSVYVTAGKLNASYVTGSYEFIKRLVFELSKVGIIKTCRWPELMSTRDESALAIHKDKRSHAYTIKLNSKRNLETLFHFFYDGVDESMYLNRKYDIFAKELNISEEMPSVIRAIPCKYPIIPIGRNIGATCKQGASVPEIDTPKTSAKPAIKCTTTTRIFHSMKQRNKKILLIKNNDGRLECKRCGGKAAILYMVNQLYCPLCFQTTKSKRGRF